MGKGDQKRRVMQKHQLDEPGYYAFASVVGLQRHFNVLTAKLLGAYGFDPLSFLESQAQGMPDHIGPANFEQWLTQDCSCPMTLLRAFVSADAPDQDESLAGVIAGELVATTVESLARWSDPNHFTPQLLRRYTAPGGTPLDEQAVNMSRPGRDVDVAHLVDFILAHPRGQQSYRPPLSLSQRISRRFEAVAGFRLTEHYATTLLATISSRYQVSPEHLEQPPF